MSGVFVINLFRIFLAHDPEYFSLNFESYILEVLAEITRFADILLVFLEAYSLEKQEIGFKKVQLLKKVILASCFIYIFELPIFFFMYLASTVPFIGLLLAFLLALTWIFSLLGYRVVIAISFLVVGIKNRVNYGNYLISGAIMYLIYGVLSVLLWPIIQTSINVMWVVFYDFSGAITVLGLIITYFMIAPFMVSLYSIYFLFFSIRIKNRYFTTWSIIGLFIQYFSIIDIFFLSFRVDIFSILLILLIVIPSVLGIVLSMKFFELGKYFRKGMRVFISHSVEDFKKYRIEEIANYLESQKDIGRVFYCEVDLSGNIDAWMQKIVPKCHMVLFISTEGSLISEDCKTELDLAKTNNLHIVPILGVALAWDDLKDLELHREFGAQFEPMEFEKFCNELYENIMKYKRALQSDIPDKKKKS